MYAEKQKLDGDKGRSKSEYAVAENLSGMGSPLESYFKTMMQIRKNLTSIELCSTMIHNGTFRF